MVGRAMYIGLVSKDARTVTAKLPRTGHVYESQSGAYHGQTSQLKLSLPKSQGMVLAVLPYEVDRLAAHVVDAQIDAGEDAVIEYRIEAAGDPTTHVVRMDVYASNGDRLDHYSRNLVAPEGEGEVRIPFRHDVVGKCRVVLRDVATDSSTALHVMVGD